MYPISYRGRPCYDVAITREQAIARCEELLVPVFKAEAKSGVLPGAIWYQDLAPGKEVTESTKIVLKYSPAPAELQRFPNLREGLKIRSKRSSGELSEAVQSCVCACGSE